ncbi:L-histidine N(alpha)-methyltransferase [Sphingobacterium griseoflavum]|uniref:Dimethylhistidine N-methyltransferase n=1 Tax=Sphingobacterium griseoflavum TaxID=1474952 RepID=A0ABQ3HXS2_9SPHI|nr:L-histidine N(alpha)-methyltransferase [Sphingobacterium griseoflavum]GHE30870.1 dimethylhistidine N-methyltransferase [Sphingobacterium griseoflavum]
MYMRKEEVGRYDVDHHPKAGTFYGDVLAGLSKDQKSLPAKYFYDAAGDALFQQIMRCPEYYLTRCEEEIFKLKTRELLRYLFKDGEAFDLIELGAGDASKTQYLLAELLAQEFPFTYRPIDISGHIIEQLEERLKAEFPKIAISSFQGDYFQGLADIQRTGNNPKVVLFLGANIGNMSRDEAKLFCMNMRTFLDAGDRALIGFDLMKNPRIVQAAYDDSAGLTRQFNMNLLHRMNHELGADFMEDLFEHYCQYDPLQGACNSYLVSILDHTVHFPNKDIAFASGEVIHMEVSQKYRFEDTQALAEEAGFRPVHAVYDRRGWFVDVIWEAF